VRDGLDLALAQLADLVFRQFRKPSPIGADVEILDALLRREHLRKGRELVVRRAVLVDELLVDQHLLAVRENDDEPLRIPNGIFRRNLVSVVDRLSASSRHEIDVGTLGLNDAHDLAVQEEKVVGLEVAVQQSLGECHGIVIGREMIPITDVPPGVRELCVDLDAGARFRTWVRHAGSPPPNDPR
jgi:hypothetical protein